MPGFLNIYGKYGIQRSFAQNTAVLSIIQGHNDLASQSLCQFQLWEVYFWDNNGICYMTRKKAQDCFDKCLC